MAFVDPIPTYRLQALAKLTNWLVVSYEHDTAEKICDKVICDGGLNWETWRRPKDHEPCIDPSHDDLAEWEEEGSKWESVCNAYRSRGLMSKRGARAASDIIVDIAKTYPPNIVWSDEHARMAILYNIFSRKWASHPGKDSSLYLEKTAKEFVCRQIPGSKLSFPKFVETWDKIPSPRKVCPWQFEDADATEALFTKSLSKDQKAKLSRGFDPRHDITKEDVEIEVERFKGVKVFRVMSIHIVVDTNTGNWFILDRPSITQLVSRTRALANWTYITKVKTANNEMDEIRIGTLVAWMVNNMRRVIYENLPPGRIAKSCKTSVGILHSLLFNEHEPDVVSRQAREQAAAQEQDCHEVMKMDKYWHEAVMDNCAHPKTWLDISYLFHILPGTDADPFAVYNKVVKTMRSANTAMTEEKDKFLAYAKSSLLISTLSMHPSADAFIACEDGYDHKEAVWFQKTMSGFPELPPESEWGKAWIKGFYTYSDYMSTWWLSASDVTHVMNDMASCMAERDEDRLTQMLHNEMMYVFIYGKVLSKKWDPDIVRDILRRDEMVGQNIAMMAGKAENSKFGQKVRETWSAADTWREPQSEIDRNTAVVGACVPGNSMRAGSYSVTKVMSEFAQKLDGSGKAFASCQDVTSWSPKLDRKLLLEFSDMIADMYCDDNRLIRMSQVWKETMFGVNKRGAAAIAAMDTGGIMGFTGSLDTILHSTILGYVVRRCKDKGVLLERTEHHSAEYAKPMALIDDAAMLVEMRDSIRTKEGEERMERFKAVMLETYKSLGFDIDPIKSVLSTVKAVFLNRCYGMGAEVPTWRKLASKIDRDPTKRFENLSEQIQGVFGKARGASERGGCPVMLYKMATMRALELLEKVWPKTTTKTPELMSLYLRAPLMIGGLGAPSIIEMLTQGRPDKLCSWLTDEMALAHVYDMTNMDTRAEGVRKLIASLIKRPFARTHAVNVMSNPICVTFADTIDSTAPSRSLFEKAARDNARDPSVKWALDNNRDPNLEKALAAYLMSMPTDAAVLQAFSKALPSEVFHALLAKARSSEVLTRFINPKFVRSAMLKQRRMDRDCVTIFVDATKTNRGSIDKGMNGYDVAYLLRTDYHRANGYMINNHTVPVATEHLIHTTSSNCMIKLEWKGFQPCVGEKRSDWSWARTRTGSSHGVRSMKGNTLDSPALKACPQSVRDIVTAISLIRWMAGGDTMSPLERLLAYLWTGLTDGFADALIPVWDSKSLKRALTSGFVGNASIACFPNVQGAVQVHTQSYFTWLDTEELPVNGITVIQEMRVVGILDRYCGSMWTVRYYVPYVDMLPTAAKDEKISGNHEWMDDMAKAIGRPDRGFAGVGDSIRSVLAALPQLCTEPPKDDLEEEVGEKIPMVGASFATSIPSASGLIVIKPGVGLWSGKKDDVGTDDCMAPKDARRTPAMDQLRATLHDPLSSRMNGQIQSAAAEAARLISGYEDIAPNVTPDNAHVYIMDANSVYAMVAIANRLDNHLSPTEMTQLSKYVAMNQMKDGDKYMTKNEWNEDAKFNLVFTLARIHMGWQVARDSYLAKYCDMSLKTMIKEMSVASHNGRYAPWKTFYEMMANKMAGLLQDDSPDEAMDGVFRTSMMSVNVTVTASLNIRMGAREMIRMVDDNNARKGATVLYDRLRDAIAYRSKREKVQIGMDAQVAAYDPPESFSVDYSSLKIPMMSMAPAVRARTDDNTLKDAIVAAKMGMVLVGSYRNALLDDVLEEVGMTREEAEDDDDVIAAITENATRSASNVDVRK